MLATNLDLSKVLGSPMPDFEVTDVQTLDAFWDHTQCEERVSVKFKSPIPQKVKERFAVVDTFYYDDTTVVSTRCADFDSVYFKCFRTDQDSFPGHYTIDCAYISLFFNEDSAVINLEEDVNNPQSGFERCQCEFCKTEKRANE